MMAKSVSTSTRRRGLERNARQSGGDGPGSSPARPLLQVAEEARELDEDDERDQDARRR